MNFHYKEVLKVVAGGGLTALLILQLRQLFKSIR